MGLLIGALVGVCALVVYTRSRKSRMKLDRQSSLIPLIVPSNTPQQASPLLSPPMIYRNDIDDDSETAL